MEASMRKPGDVVAYKSRRWVVVDVSTFEGDASLDRVVLRPEDDPAGELEAIHPDETEYLDHLSNIPGWVETAPGEWRKA
jgi:hypothetical protein